MKRKRLHELNVDEFMTGSFSSDENEFEEISEDLLKSEEENHQLKVPKKKSKSQKLKKPVRQDEDDVETLVIKQQKKEKKKDKTNKSLQSKNKLIHKLSKESTCDEALEESDELSETDEKSLEIAMGLLKDKDPEFYKFLEENDKTLLDFAASDDDDDDLEENIEEIDDENVNEDDDESLTTKKITKKLLEEWKIQLKENHDLTIIRKVISGFKAAVQQANGEEMTSYKIDNDEVFNGIIHLCLIELVPALHKFLKLPGPVMSKDVNQINPTKSKTWKKICNSVKSYLSDIIKLSTVISEPAIVNSLLKHILCLIPFYLSFVKMSRFLIKKLIRFWSVSEETVRILSFLCIIRTVRLLPSDYLDYTLKQMYMEYVKNCKFTSKTSWPSINFMKRSLVELYSLNLSVAYQHAFVFIRQLSIHLRNAITIKKKDSIQTVYNWQFVHCLLFWISLLSSFHLNDLLKTLIYPLIQTIIGTISLIPTSKYIPLRFHLVRGLIILSKDTDTFIPILPLIYETLNIVDFKKKHVSLSMKPMDFDCALKLSKSQLQENGFKDKVIEQVYELILEYLQTQAHTIGFPELVLPTIIHLKSFLKLCKISNYCRKLKQLLDKIQENSSEITTKRKSVTFKLSDSDSIKQWENDLKEKGMPLVKFYESLKKLQVKLPDENENLQHL